MKQYVSIFIILITFSCQKPQYTFHPIPEFSDKTNMALESFLIRTAGETGRKIAVFDGDGTVIGQAPHYLADECLYQYALENPGKKTDIIAKMKNLSNVSLPYVQLRVHFFEGENIDFVRSLGERFFDRYYRGKIYKPMKELITILKENGFEIYIVSASPEALYQKFLSKAFGIPITSIIGVKSVIHGGLITNRIVEPVPQDEGKKEAIETFIQETPLFVAGNSRGDREMIESSRGIHMIINPDEHREEGEKESIADYARRMGWLTERIRDIDEKGFPSVSSKTFGIKKNKSHE